MSSVVADNIRRFWLPRLNEVSGRPSAGLSAWIVSGGFRVAPLTGNAGFILGMTDLADFREAVAADCNRLGIVAIETLAEINKSTVLPKTIAWMLLRNYYASYFSAGALMRLCGRGTMRIERGQATYLNSIANAYGSAQPFVQSGFYSWTADTQNSQVEFRSLGGGGSHEEFWEVFDEFLRSLVQKLLSVPGGGVSAQNVAIKIGEILSIMSGGAGTGGRWLSQIRNRLNYRHEFDAWYPHRGYSQNAYEKLFSIVESWNKPAISIQLTFPVGRELHQFAAACACIVAIYREVAQDMADRCPVGKSFHKIGIESLLNVLNTPGSRSSGAKKTT